MPPGDAQRVGPLQVAGFLDELALLAVLAVAGTGLASSTAASWLLAILLPLAAAVLWGMWLAPRASRRLAHPARLGAKLALVVVAAALLASAGAVWWAAAFLIVSAPLLIAAERSEH
jgi:hypothetical protein